MLHEMGLISTNQMHDMGQVLTKHASVRSRPTYLLGPIPDELLNSRPDFVHVRWKRGLDDALGTFLRTLHIIFRLTKNPRYDLNRY
jgi:hypothetical protein